MNEIRLVSKVLNRSYSFPETKSEMELLRNAKNKGENTITDFQHYMAVFNICTEFGDQILDSIPLLNTFNNRICDLQDEYMPSGPPMSPVTKTFFSSWMTLDALISDKLTIGQLYSRYIKDKKVMGYAVNAIDHLNKSFGSLYQVVGGDLKKTILWDLVEKCELEASIPVCDYSVATYKPNIGDIWYARILPPLDQQRLAHTVFGTPLIFRHTKREDWEGYLSRRIASKDKDLAGLKKHLKHGDSFGYWLEFAFQAYSNHTSEIIYAEGLPDIKDSRPHGGLDGGRISNSIDTPKEIDTSLTARPTLYFPLPLLQTLNKMKPGTCVTGSVRLGVQIVPVIVGSFTRTSLSFYGLEMGPPDDMETKFRYIDSKDDDELLEVLLMFKQSRFLAFDFDPLFVSVKHWMHNVLSENMYGFCFYNYEDRKLITSFTSSLSQEDVQWLIRNISRAYALTRNNFKRIMSASQFNETSTFKGNKRYYVGVGENENHFINKESKLIAIEDIDNMQALLSGKNNGCSLTHRAQGRPRPAAPFL